MNDISPGRSIAISSAFKGNLESIGVFTRFLKSWAFAYNSLGVPVAAGVLYPFFGLLLSPIIAAAAMSFSSVTVIGNALRLRRLAL